MGKIKVQSTPTFILSNLSISHVKSSSGVAPFLIVRDGFRYLLPIKFVQSFLGGASLPASLPADLH